MPIAPTNGFRTHETKRMRLLATSTLGLDGPMLCGPTPGFSTAQLAGSTRTPLGFFGLRGTRMAARFVMKYLMSKGVEAARITIASYGVQLLVKER